MRAEDGVEWDLVDYGAGRFHVASYQLRAAEAPQPGAAKLDADEGAEPARIPDCFFCRCWSALRDGYNHAA